MKKLSCSLLLLPLAAPVLLAGTERPARADVIPICLFDEPPQCSDGIDNDGDGAVDLSDFGCAGSADGSELFFGFQPPPCREISILLWEQFLTPVWPPDGCPQCGLVIIDWDDLLVFPPDKLIDEVHPEWEISVAATLPQPVAGINDSPNVPNLVLRYKGQQRIGPGNLGSILKLADGLPANLQYVGRARSARTGKLVTNIGILSPQQ